MIQRFSVHFRGADKFNGVLEGLKGIGFSDNALRVSRDRNSDSFNTHAYHDGDIDKMNRLHSDRMGDYCVQIWSRIGKARIVLTEFGDAGRVLEYADKEYSDWESG